jgi:hypothetical protein
MMKLAWIGVGYVTYVVYRMVDPWPGLRAKQSVIVGNFVPLVPLGGYFGLSPFLLGCVTGHKIFFMVY